MAVAMQAGREERRRFTVAEFERMVEAGVFRADERLELIHGEIIRMSPIGRRHVAAVLRLTTFFSGAVAGRALVNVQSPVVLGDEEEPLPDVTLLRPRADFYESAKPAAADILLAVEVADILLAVEVADSSLAYDRGTKLPLYASVGIREVWLLNLQDDVLEVYGDPGPQGYARSRTYQRGERVAPEALPDLRFAVEDLLPSGERQRAAERGRARGWDLGR